LERQKRKNSIIIPVPVITSIKQQKTKKRVNIFLDGKFGFGLNLENFVKYNLKINQDLSTEKIEEIKNNSNKDDILNKLLSFATFRPRSEKELIFWLKRKKIDARIHKYLFDKLKHFCLLDDFKFTKWWIEQRQSFRPKPKKILIQELRFKGIKRDIFDDILKDFEIDEEKIARKLIEKKKYKWEKFDIKKRKQKMSMYLAGKGFDWNVISKVI